MKFYEDKNYIEMCEKAEEMQEKWKPERGDYYRKYHFSKNKVKIYSKIAVYPPLSNHKRFLLKNIGKKNSPFVWLPRQDQLQEMLFDEFYDNPFDIEIIFNEWMVLDKYILMKYNFLEEAWLEFVMKEKYNKVWNNSGRVNEWVEI